MNPNDEFHKNPVRTRDPEESRLDAYDILAEMKICTKCHDHKPCGCEPLGKCPNCLEEYFDSNDRVCYSCDYDEAHDPNFNHETAPGRKSCINCGSPNTAQGGFCSRRCRAIFVGEA